jgi:hypothetical protein
MRLLPTTSTVLTGCAIVALAGCTVSPRTASARHPQAAHQAATSQATARRTPASGGMTVTSPQQRAVADAASILASFVAPPGARRLSRAPAADRGMLGRPVIPGLPYEVDLTSWWQVPGRPDMVLGWERAHLPRRFAPAGGSDGAARPGTRGEQDEAFSLPAVAGVLDQRNLIITAVEAGAGVTAVRVDGWVIWIAARPAAERVPASARAVSAEVLPGDATGRPRPLGPVLITDPSRVGRIMAFIDGLPRAPFLPKSCPAFSPGVVRVAFLARIGGPPLAVFTAELTRCYTDFTINGTPQPELSPDPSVAHQLLALAGLRLAGY